MVKSVIMNASSIVNNPLNSHYWDWLKKADVIFIYCSRTNESNIIVKDKNDFDKQGHWWWWEIPILVKKVMRPDAKMIVQFDDDLIWVFHQDWNWFGDKPDNHGSPEQFFKDTGLLEVADMYFTVLENPPWGKYTTKPIRYMPLPQLWRYWTTIDQMTKVVGVQSLRETHKDFIAILRHTSVIGSVQHEVDNVLIKYPYPVIYFATANSPRIQTHHLTIEGYSRLGEKLYMNKLREAFLALDDCENYIGWSRFAMECALLGIPCIGSNYATKLFFPELYTDHKDYARQIDLINQLINDGKFYERIAKDGYLKCMNHLEVDSILNRFLDNIHGLNVSETPIDFDREVFLAILDKLLPWDVPPNRPNNDDMVTDPYSRTQITQRQWDTFYGPFYEKFIKDSKVLNTMIREVLDRKEGKSK